MRKVILLISVLAVIALGWFLYFNTGEPAAPVAVCEIKKGNIASVLEFSGKVEPASMYSVMSETGGIIASLSVAEGGRVGKNDILFELDASQIKAQLEEARLKYNALSDSAAQMTMAAGGSGVMAEEKAKLALALSQTTGYDYESLNEAFGSRQADAITQAFSSLSQSAAGKDGPTSLNASDFDTDSQLELAALAVKSLQKQVDAMTCRSRIAGTVIALNVNVGEVLSPGLPAMVIADTDHPVITGYVYEKDLSGLSEGMSVVIMSGSEKFPGTLTRVGAAAAEVGDAAAFDTMAKVQIKPDGAFGKIIGAVVDLKIVLSEKSGVLTVPLDCLTDDDCVFVVGDDGIAEKRAIVTGFENESSAEVVRGLSAGERVIAAPLSIREGQHVSYDRGE